MRTATSSFSRSLLGAVIALLVVVTPGACIRPDASELQIGDAVAVVTNVLGEHTAEYRSTSEIEFSEFAHFEFSSQTNTASPSVSAAGLPEVVGRALWFPFLTTAGTLVYLDSSDRVTAVFSAGT